MRANRRRRRSPDPLAHPEAIRTILCRLRELLPDIMPKSEKQLIKMLNAVRHVETRPASDTRRGRPPRWKRDVLLRVANHLRYLLERETQGRISLNSFIGVYLRVLSFPPDVQEPLVAGEINIFEARQLARLTTGRLGISPSVARSRRGEILRAHLMAHGSQELLMRRVDDLLRGKRVPPAGNEKGDLGITVVDDLLDIDPYDTSHLFWEELRRISIALRSVTPEDVDDKILEEFLSSSDHLSGVLARIEKRRRQRDMQSRHIVI